MLRYSRNLIIFLEFNLPRFVAWRVCLVGRRFWLWSRFQQWRQRLKWTNHLRTETGTRFYRHLNYQSPTVWTCNQNSGLRHLSAKLVLEPPSENKKRKTFWKQELFKYFVLNSIELWNKNISWCFYLPIIYHTILFVRVLYIHLVFKIKKKR